LRQCGALGDHGKGSLAMGTRRLSFREEIMRISTAAAAASLAFVAALPVSTAAKPASPEMQKAAAQCFGKEKTTWRNLIDSCTKVLDADVSPDVKVGAFYNRGAAYERVGDGARALADYTASLKLKPNFARALIARGTLYVGQNKLDLAIADLDKAIAVEPKSAIAFSNRALAHLRKNDNKKAIADLTRAIEIDPNDASSYAARGAVYVIMSDNARAMEDFNRAIALDSKLMIALLNRGVLRAGSGDKAGAKADFKAVLALEPNHQLAKEQLAALERSGG
jgi:tetratricopeptide (TPR) repeat protein